MISPLFDPAEKATVLVVDDTPDNLTLISGILRNRYRVKVASSGEKALKIATTPPVPDLILLDIMMPDMDGYEVCRQLKSSPLTKLIPTIFLTAKAEASDETYGLSLGAVDYISKPINPEILLARVKTQLQLKEAADFLRDKNTYLEQEVNKRTAEIATIQKVTILSLASLAETRDTDTGGHLWRTQRYIHLIAQKLKNHPRFKQTLTDKYIETLVDSAPLHDIGKVGIPDHILLKPGKLTKEEFEIIKTHPRIGYTTIFQAEKFLDVEVDFLRIAQEVILSHHEKWDGSGYPNQLKGEDIPVSARLMALADVYDSLISARVYRQPMAHKDVADIIIAGRGSHFDPDIVDAFVASQEEFQMIVKQFSERTDPLSKPLHPFLEDAPK